WQTGTDSSRSRRAPANGACPAARWRERQANPAAAAMRTHSCQCPASRDLVKRPICPASTRPSTEQAPVTTQVHCQPPTRLATQATSGGPTNWPKEDHCCIQPTVVETVRSLGASLTASENSVPGITPP